MSLLIYFIILISLCLPAFTRAAFSKNSDPIVLVHGFAGWGRDSFHGFSYWGGFHDLQEDLKYEGNRVLTASVGSFSSNYDRAIDLYAQIKGGCADYGVTHSQKFGHARFGRCYTQPLYPQWDENNKLHFIGHSQGGQTIRLLLQLLKEGSKNEILSNSDETHELFRGNKNWVTSITTIATPNNGTSLTNIADMFMPTLQSMFTYFLTIVGINSEPKFDLKLEHWGLVRKKNESLVDYFDRAFKSKIWYTTDISKWDLSPEGAREYNASEKVYQDIYYFSYSTQSTNWVNPFNNCKFSILTILDIPASAIGCFSQKLHGKVLIDEKWHPNDGIVNTYSMAAPFHATKINFIGTPQIGLWNDMGIKKSWNHLDIIALFPNLVKPYYTVKEFYSNHLNLLHSL